MNQAIYKLTALSKTFFGPAEDLTIFKNLSLEIADGESVAIVGASGSGKSTLLHLMSTLDAPSSGEILFSGKSLINLSEAEKAAFRNKDLGFIFQLHNLLPEFSALENVAMQAIIGGMEQKTALALAAEKLDLVGLAKRKDHTVTTLSGGERQRAAIARAILNSPRVLMADEPTGNLDENSGAQIAELLFDLNYKLGTTLVVVTHNPELASRLGRCLELKAGILHERGVKNSEK